MDWGYNEENGEKYPPYFDGDCSDKFPGFLHISDNKGNDIICIYITILHTHTHYTNIYYICIIYMYNVLKRILSVSPLP